MKYYIITFLLHFIDSPDINTFDSYYQYGINEYEARTVV